MTLEKIFFLICGPHFLPMSLLWCTLNKLVTSLLTRVVRLPILFANSLGSNLKSGLIGIQTAWHSGGIPESFIQTLILKAVNRRQNSQGHNMYKLKHISPEEIKNVSFQQ